MNIKISLAGTEIRLHIHCGDTISYFKDFLIEENCSDYDVTVNEEDIHRYPLICPDHILTPFREQYMLISHVSSFLLSYNRILFHGVAFLWRGYAWLLTGHSGVGKTTQYKLWKTLFPDEVEIINGDKPVLEVKKDETIWIYPSPWGGKEKYSGSKSGKLAGIILLKQYEWNEISRINVDSSVLPLFDQFLMICDTADEIKQVASIENAILSNIPIWLLKNRGDEISAKLTKKTLETYLEARCSEKI